MEMSRNLIVSMMIVAILLVAGICGLFLLNGHSLDLTDRDVRLIVTDSMEGEVTEYDIPTIKKDSLVMVRMLGSDEMGSLKIGDVIQFVFGGKLIHHRVIDNDTQSGAVLTKGDNSSSVERVDYKDIKGIVVGTSHIMGTIVKFVKEHWIFLFVLIGFFLLATETLKWVRRDDA